MSCDIAGWNTWDPNGVNRFIQAELDLEIILATMDAQSGLILDEYSFNVMEERKALLAGEVKLPEESLGTEEERKWHRKLACSGIPDWPKGRIRRAGPRTLDLSRGWMELEHEKGRGQWCFNACASKETLAINVKVPQPSDDLRMILIVRGAWGRNIQHQFESASGLILAFPRNVVYQIKCSATPLAVCGAADHRQLLGRIPKATGKDDLTSPAIALILPFAGFEVTAGPKGTAVAPAQVVADPPEANTDLTEALVALEAAVGWNICWDALYNRIQLPVNKEWVWVGFKGMETLGRSFPKEELDYAIGPAMFSWDSGFNTMMAAQIDANYAQEIAASAIAYNRMPDGGFSTCRMGRYQLEAMTNPPTLTWACSRLFEKTHNKTFLTTVYPDLKAWYFWMKRQRDRNGDGLYEWGINLNHPLSAPAEAASRLESGLDNSPMYYDIPYSQHYGTMELNCVDLSSFQAVCARELTKMAKALGLEADVDQFQNEYQRLKDLINDRLWDESRGIYANRFWDGRFSDVVTPTSFYPLLGGIPDQARAKRMITEWLNTPDHFGGQWPLPSVDAAHPSYLPDGNYWRGRVWPPMNYLVYHGLRRYDRKAASALAQRSLKLLLNDWRRHGHIHENYSALTGYGEATVDKGVCSCSFYTWGGLLALMALEDDEQ